MPLPPIGDRREARLLSRLVLGDARLDALRRQFSPEEGLPAVLEHGLERRAVLAGRDAAELRPDLDQLDRVLGAWRQDLAAPAEPVEDPLQALRSDASRWDFRHGRERDAIPSDDLLLPPPVRDLVLELADDWGLTATSVPPAVFYDAIVPIGGLVRANVGRPATVAAWMKGGLQTDVVLGLAADRTCSPAERQLAELAGVPQDTEQDALRHGLELAFDLRPGAWKQQAAGLSANDTAEVPVLLGVAPPLPNRRRANTGESFAWVRDQTGLLGGGRVLQVTTSIYWIANQIDARITLPDDVEVHTAGYRQSVTPFPPQRFAPQHYLQEIKAAVDALPRLLAWAEPGSG